MRVFTHTLSNYSSFCSAHIIKHELIMQSSSLNTLKRRRLWNVSQLEKNADNDVIKNALPNPIRNSKQVLAWLQSIGATSVIAHMQTIVLVSSSQCTYKTFLLEISQLIMPLPCTCALCMYHKRLSFHFVT